MGVLQSGGEGERMRETHRGREEGREGGKVLAKWL